MTQRMDSLPTWEPGWPHSMRELAESSALETHPERAVSGKGGIEGACIMGEGFLLS